MNQVDEENENSGSGTATVKRKKTTKKSLKPPSSWKVLFHNDDFTPMEFVVWVLQEIFHHNETTATSIMLDVHKKGIGVAGIYSFQLAEQKVFDSMTLAKEHEFPLMITAEQV